MSHNYDDLIEEFFDGTFEAVITENMYEYDYIFPRMEVEDYIVSLLAIPYQKFIDFVSMNYCAKEITPSGIPQISNYEMCTLEVTKVLRDLDNPGLTCGDIGRQLLSDGIVRKEGAYFKFGENHVKGASFHGLTHCSYNQWFLTCLGYVFPSLDEELRQYLSARTLLRNPLFHIVVSRAVFEDVNIANYMPGLSDSTKKRRSSSCLHFFNIIKRQCDLEHVNIHKIYFNTDPSPEILPASPFVNTYLEAAENHAVSTETNDNKRVLYYINKKGLVSIGYFEDNTFTVLKGSELCLSVANSYSKANERIELLNDSASRREDRYVLNVDLKFNSPSHAASVCLGRSANGWTEWKNSYGETLDECQRKDKPKHKLIKTDSWELLSEDKIVKHCDASVFERFGSNIPKSMRWFWRIVSEPIGAGKDIRYKYGHRDYIGFVKIYSNDISQIYWDKSLIQDLDFNVDADGDDFPDMFFERIGGDYYEVSFANIPTEQSDEPIVNDSDFKETSAIPAHPVTAAKSLKEYLNDMTSLVTSKFKGICGPHKPVLLITIFDMIGRGLIITNQIHFNQCLIDEFGKNWDRLVPKDFPFNKNINDPFVYLESAPFYHLKRKTDDNGATGWSKKTILSTFEFAYIDDTLFELAKDSESRFTIINTLIETFNLNRDEGLLSFSFNDGLMLNKTDELDQSLKTIKNDQLIAKIKKELSSMRIERICGVKNPEKAIFLISLFNLIGSGRIRKNKIIVNDVIVEEFNRTWDRLVSRGGPFVKDAYRAFISMGLSSFYHLHSDTRISYSDNIHRKWSINDVKKRCKYSYFNNDLFTAMGDENTRKEMIEFLIKEFELIP